jgi:VCBS repeat-containing protein
MLSSVVILSSGVALTNMVEAADNSNLIFSEDLEWMKSQASLVGDNLTIDFSPRFAQLNAATLQLDATTSGNVVTVSKDNLKLNLSIKGFGATVIKVTAKNQHGEIVTDQFQLTVNKKGDINGDGLVTPADATMIYQVINGKLQLSTEQLKALDINGDGKITNVDASLLMSNYVGKSTDNTINNNFYVNLSEINDAPITKTDSYSVNEDTTLSTNVSNGVLSNDLDIENHNLSAKVITGPQHGDLTFYEDGTFTYKPHTNYFGQDRFVYLANDGKINSQEESVTINVAPVNDAPVANASHLAAVEDVVASGVLTGTDVDSTTLTYSLVDNGQKGTVTITNPATGAFVYQPQANANGKDQFTFKVSDGTLESETATITVDIQAVNDAPVTQADTFTIAEDTTLQATTSILANDSDVENDPLTATLVTGPTNGNVTINQDGTFTYVPSANFAGTDQFTYKANDGQADSAAETVTIQVTPVNDAPTATSGTLAVTEDIAANGTLQGMDIDGDGLTFSMVENGKKGTVTIIDPATGAYIYQPHANDNGTDQFTFKVSDGTLESETVTVAVNIQAVNDAPVTKSDQYTIAEDTTLQATTSILANDSDVENDSLTATLVTGTAKGTVTLNQDGTFTYVPNANFTGTDQFTYKASDGQADSAAETVTIQVTAVNDAPTAAAGTLTVTEDIAGNGTLNGADIDGDGLTFSIVENGKKGTVTIIDPATGAYIYQPHANANGTDHFTFKVSDGTLESEIVTVAVTINAVNDAPVTQADTFTIAEDTTLQATTSVLANDSDVENDPLTTTLVSGTTNGTVTLHQDGTFTYVPNANFAGTDRFTYKANDGQVDSATETVTIRVTPVNDAPIAVPGTLTATEDIASNGILTAHDVDGDALTYIIVENGQKGTVSLTGNNGDFTYTPHPNANGTDSFTFKVNDGQADSITVTVDITIDAVDDAPTISNVMITGQTMSGATVDGSYTFTDVDNDPEGNTLLQWYRGLKADGSDKEAISGANSKQYTIQDGDVDYYLFFEVKPEGLVDTFFSPASSKITARDVDAPTAVVLAPGNGTVDVSVNDHFVVTFSEKVIAGSGKITIIKNDDQTVVASFAANDLTNITVNENQVTIKNPGLAEDTSYYVTIDAEAFTDVAGNPFTGIQGNGWFFTTAGQSSLLAAADPFTPLTEADLKANGGAFITIDLAGDKFKDVVSVGDFALNNAPTGLTILDAFTMSETQAMLFLDFDGTDFDTNITNFSVTAKESATVKGKAVTSNSMVITAEIESHSAFISEYIVGSGDRSAIEVYLPSNGNPSEMGVGYSLEVHQWLNSGKKNVITQPLFPMWQAVTIQIINWTWYDFFDITSAPHFSHDLELAGPNFVVNAIVLKKDGKIVDVVGDPVSSAAKPILPTGGTIVRKPGKNHGSDLYVKNDWDLYPKDTYQFIGRHNN